jgi:hypothetical protein
MQTLCADALKEAQAARLAAASIAVERSIALADAAKWRAAARQAECELSSLRLTPDLNGGMIPNYPLLSANLASAEDPEADGISPAARRARAGVLRRLQAAERCAAAQRARAETAEGALAAAVAELGGARAEAAAAREGVAAAERRGAGGEGKGDGERVREIDEILEDVARRMGASSRR